MLEPMLEQKIELYFATLYSVLQEQPLANQSVWTSDSSSVGQKYRPCPAILEDFLKIQKVKKCQNIL